MRVSGSKPGIEMPFLPFSRASRRVSTDSIVSDNDCYVGVVNLSVPRTMTIATPAINNPAGLEFIIKDEVGNAGTNNITIATEGAQTIDGSATIVISVDHGYVHLKSDGSNLFIIG